MKTGLLDRVMVAAPCHEDWDAMQGNDEIRFCSHCAKDVHNLSAMTRAGAEALIRKSGGRLCVRYVTRADKTIVSAPPKDAALFKHARRASKLAASAFTAALTFTPAANAQTSVTLNQTTHAEATPTQQPAAQIGSGNAVIVGTVLDQSEVVIPAAKIKLTDTVGAIRTTETNDEGVYRLDNLPSGVFTLEIESVGFIQHKTENIGLFGGMEQRINATLEVAKAIMGGAMIGVSSSAPPLIYHYEEREKIGERPATSEEFDALLRDTLVMTALQTKIRDDAQVNATNEWGETILMLMVRWGSLKSNLDTLAVLLKSGADVHARSEFGVTPLMYAMLAYDEKSAQVLIDAGADVNARDKDNRTALMFAAMGGRVETIKVLLKAKAEHGVRDVEGKTALTFAMENNHEEAIKVLRAGGAVE